MILQAQAIGVTPSSAPRAPRPRRPARSGEQLDHLVDQVAGNIGVDGKGRARLFDGDSVPEAQQIGLVLGTFSRPSPISPFAASRRLMASFSVAVVQWIAA